MLQQISIDTKPIPGVFFDTEIAQAVAIRWRPGIIPEGPQEQRRVAFYVKPDGSLFELPLAFNEDEQTVGFMCRVGSGRPRDLYEAKGFRKATADDVIACKRRVAENEKLARARQLAVDPLHRDERMARMLADAIRESREPVQPAPARGKP